MDALIRRFRDTDAENVSALIRRTLFEVNSKDYTNEQLEEVAAWYTVEKLKKMAQTKHIFVAQTVYGYRRKKSDDKWI